MSIVLIKPKLLTNLRMKIQTGRGTIPLITLIAIWSVSALTSLPGLAVSPILGSYGFGYPDVDFASFLAHYSFHSAGW